MDSSHWFEPLPFLALWHRSRTAGSAAVVLTLRAGVSATRGCKYIPSEGDAEVQERANYRPDDDSCGGSAVLEGANLKEDGRNTKRQAVRPLAIRLAAMPDGENLVSLFCHAPWGGNPPSSDRTPRVFPREGCLCRRAGAATLSTARLPGVLLRSPVHRRWALRPACARRDRESLPDCIRGSNT
jgi:hypothetical protein